MKTFFIALICTLPVFSFSQAANYSGNFNGSNASVNLGTTVGNSGIRSIEFWFKPAITMSPSTTADGWTFVNRDDATQYREYGVYIRGTDWSSVGGVGDLCFFMRDNGTLHEVHSNANTWTAATWHHVAGVIDPSAGLLLYIDGVLQIQTDATGTMAVETDNTNPTKIGCWSTVRHFQGEMEELRFWNRAISQSEVQAKMCQNLNPANETGLSGYWKFDEGSGAVLTDQTTNAYNGTVSGMTWINDSPCQQPGQYVMKFDGSGDYIDMGTNAGNGVRSIEFWFMPENTIDQNTTYSGITFVNRNDGIQLHEYGVYIRGTDWSSVGGVGLLCFFMRDIGTLHEIKSNSNTWTAGTWYHVAGVIDPVTGMSLYINGSLQTMIDPSGTIAVQTDNGNPTSFGVWNSTTRYFEGRMDEVRFWNRAITQLEIQNKMCLHLNAANETGLTGYWNFNEGNGAQVLDSTAVPENGIVHNAVWVIDNYCQTEGTTEYGIDHNVVVYPNPSTGAFTISTALPEAYLEIFNSLGAVVISKKISATDSFTLENQANGIYLLRITSESDGKVMYVQKISKQ